MSAPLVDETRTHVYAVTLRTVLSTAANPLADDAEIRQALLENLLDWLANAGTDAARPMFLDYALLESRED